MEYDFGKFFILNFKSGNRAIINRDEISSIFENNVTEGTKGRVEIEMKSGTKFTYEGGIDEMMKDIQPFTF